MRVDPLLETHLPPPHPPTLTPGRALGVLLRNLVLARVPLYALKEWAAPHVPALLGVAAGQTRWLEDDRVGRALDRLFDADRVALLTGLVVQMVRGFDVKLDELHNDSITITPGRPPSIGLRCPRGSALGVTDSFRCRP
ncbi:MAG: DUF4277 domain-containing protein [Myxococcota bacterium]